MSFIDHVSRPIPLLIIRMNNKSYECYNNIFIVIKSLIGEVNVNIKYDEIIIVADYETVLRKSIKKNYTNIKLEGCYFHYIKNLWKYAKSHSLCSKILFNKAQLLIFFFKIYPYLLKEEQKVFYKKLNDFYSKLDGKYIAFFKYYNKF